MRLIVIGAPGAGKGTQAKILAAHFNARHVSTGDLLREHIEAGDEIGCRVAEIMNRGQLVPDDIVVELIRKDVESGNFIFDGFPRTIAQAQILDEMLMRLRLPLDRVIYVTISDDIIIERMAGRQTCLNCGAIYHVLHNPASVPWVCDKCGNELIVREDDSAPVVKRRLDNYYGMTEPIIEHYRNKGLVYEISGNQPIDKITESIVAELEGGSGSDYN